MVKKLTAVMMLALLAQPFCCCLFAADMADQSPSDMACCESSEAPLKDAVPAHNGSDPCDCESHDVLVMVTPENISLGIFVWKLDFIAEHPTVQNISTFRCSEVTASVSFGSLSAFHPPGWRSCQDYCVYLI